MMNLWYGLFLGLLLAGVCLGAAADSVDICSSTQKIVFRKKAARPDLVEGRFGKALSLWTDDERVLTIDSRDLLYKDCFTLGMWVRLDDSEREHVIASRGVVGSAGHWRLVAGADGRVGCHLGYSPVSIDDGGWHCLALAVSGGDVQLAVDGEVVLRATDSGEAAFSYEPVVLGPMAGAVDDVRLSAAMRDLSVVPQEPMGADASTVLLYDFNELHQSAFANRAGPYLTANPAVGGQRLDAERIRPGRFGSALSVDGDSAEKLAFRMPPGVETETLTVDLWVKLAASDQHQVIVAKGTKKVGHWEVYVREKTGYVAYFIPGLTPIEGISSTCIADNQWHFVSMGIRPDRVTISVDGEVALDHAVQGSLAPMNAPVYIGSLSDVDLSAPFPITGLIDELRLSNVYCPATETPAQGLAVDEHTIALYRFDDVRGRAVANGASVMIDPAPARLAAATGGYEMFTYVKCGERWEAMFDAGSVFADGTEFDLRADSYEVIEDSDAYRALRFLGTHPAYGYRWDVLVEARPDAPLVHFLVACDLEVELRLHEPEPMLRFWRNGGEAAVTLNQGPGNIYVGPAERGWGNAFPTAYLWDEGKEAAFFAQMSELRWLGTNRFHVNRVQSAAVDGRLGLGLWAFDASAPVLRAGRHVIGDYYLYAAERPEKPTRLAALDRMVDVFASLHPVHSAFPVNRKGGPTSWTFFAENMIKNLMVKDTGGNAGAVWSDFDFAPAWEDGLTEPISSIRISADYALKSGSYPSLWREQVKDLWDFSTTNSYVAPWIAINRLHGDAEQEAFLDRKRAGVPLFYDPVSGLIRYGTRHPLHVGDLAMSWQHFTFSMETLRVHGYSGAVGFNPALAGQFLMATDGLIEFAHKVDYVFPQWFDPYEKVPVIQNDAPMLGIVYEPWQVGTYAYLMMTAYEMTGGERYLDEARRSVDALLETMTFGVKNERYEIAYDDPVDFPITEIFGNGWGIAACERIYGVTRDEKYRRYGRDFLNNLLRVTFWYESDLSCDPKDQVLQNAGLFPAFHSYHGAAPWETIEAYLPMTVMLRGENPLTPTALLLRLFNTMRINSFWFFPPVFTDEVITSKALFDNPADYISIENFYMPERGGGHGGMGRATYMSQIALWNYLLFEALATTDDPDVMVLSLDVAEGFEAAVRSARRQFYVFNPTGEQRATEVHLTHLAGGDYQLTLTGADGQKRDRSVSHQDLAAGVRLSLEPLAYVKMTVTHSDCDAMMGDIVAYRAAQHAICRVYADYRRESDEKNRARMKVRFDRAMDAYCREEYGAAARFALSEASGGD